MKAAKKFDNVEDGKWFGGKSFRYAYAMKYNIVNKDVEQ